MRKNHWFFLRHFEKCPESPLFKDILTLERLSKSRTLLSIALFLNRRIDRRLGLSREGRKRGVEFSLRFARYAESLGAGTLRVFSSPYRRTRESAALATEFVRHDPIRIDRRLRELEPGIRFGRTFEEVCDAFPLYREAAYADFLRAKAPGAHSHIERREGDIAEFLEDIGREDRDTLVVTHAGVIEVVHNIVCGTSDEEVVAKFAAGRSIPPGALFVSRHDPETGLLEPVDSDYLLL